MKLGDEGSLSYKFIVKKERLGRVCPGSPFYYKGRLWVSLNRADGGGKLIRSLEGGEHEIQILPSTTIVLYLLSGKKIKKAPVRTQYGD
jgi:hypothetical protein